jgi:small GTP-binding protein
MTQQEYEGAKKIILMGLDNSGKTSITLSLMGVKNIPTFCSLKPTKQFFINKFKVLETEFSIWDFGGQEQFRKDYIVNFNNYIKEADKFIYVIDIQDTKRYDQALEYLTTIINLFENRNPDLDFSIFLHKYDPDLNITKKELTEDVINKFISKLRDKIPPTFNYNIFKTSIYTIFQKSKV